MKVELIGPENLRAAWVVLVSEDADDSPLTVESLEGALSQLRAAGAPGEAHIRIDDRVTAAHVRAGWRAE